MEPKRAQRRQTSAFAAFAIAGALTLLAAAPAAARNAYVPSFFNGTVAVVDTTTNTTIGTPIPVGTDPNSIAITPDGARAYVTNNGPPETVAVIDVATNTTGGAQIPLADDPTAIAITPDGSRAYVALGGGVVSVIDTASNTVVGAPIPVGGSPLGIAITPDGTRAYVSNYNDGTVSVIDTATNATVGAVIPVGTNPLGIAITPDGTRVYVANQGSNSVSVIDTATNSPLGAPISIPNSPWPLGITPNGARAYVGSGSNPQGFRAIDTATNSTLGALIPVTNDPFFIAFTPDGTRGYAATHGTVTVIDIASNAATGTIPVGPDSEGIAIVPNQGPSASFTAAPDPGVPGQPVSFNGSGSTDSDGQVVRWDWDFGDGAAAQDAGPTPSHTYAPGTYEVRLTVTDNEGCATAVVFTGQTASCNGSGAATTTRTVTVDGIPPGFRLAGKRTQKLGASVLVNVRDASEDAGVLGTGVLAVGAARGGGKAELRRFKLKRAVAQISAGGAAKLRLKVPRGAKRAAAEALGDDAKVRARVTVTLTDAAGNVSREKRAVAIVAPAGR